MAHEMNVDYKLISPPALNILGATLPKYFVDSMNEYIDKDVIPHNESYAHGLVGQINQNKKSAQLSYRLMETQEGRDLKTILDSSCKLYLQQIGFSDKIADVFQCWTVHSYSGDYNPMHDHGVKTLAGLSMILYLKVPECIQKLENPIDKGGNVYLNNSSGEVDGFTYFSWANVGTKMYNMLFPSGEMYIKPEVGRLIIFPNWLKHSVMPFFGDGERRTLSANANIFSKDTPLKIIEEYR